MNKSILNEVKRNRELMGINESELDEQGFIDAVKKGYESAKSLFKREKGTLDGTSEDVEITYSRGPKSTVFKYDTKGAINGYFRLAAQLEKLGLDKSPNYYKGTVNNIAKYVIPNEEIPNTFFGDEDVENKESNNDVFTITYEGKEYKVDKETLLNSDNRVKNSYVDIDGVRFYYELTEYPDIAQRKLNSIKSFVVAKDIKSGDVIRTTKTDTTNNDDGSTTTSTLDKEVINTELSNIDTAVILVHISPDTIDFDGIEKQIVIGV